MAELDTVTSGAGAEAARGEEGTGDFDLSDPLPDVLTRLSPAGAVARLDKASRRGRLPGFHIGPGDDRCRVAVFGTPFDKELLVRTRREPDGRTRIDFETRLHWKMPVLLAFILLVTIEPGQWLTDSLLRTYFDFYSGWVQDSWFSTMIWYYPLTVPFVPFVWFKARNQTDRTTWQASHEAVRKIASEVGGELSPPKLRRWTPKKARQAAV